MNLLQKITICLGCILWSVNLLGQDIESYEYYFLNGRYNEIIELADKEISSDSINFVSYYRKAIALQKQGKLIKSIQLLEKHQTLFSDNDKINRLLADSYFEAGQYSKAKILLKELIKKDTLNFSVLINLAKIYKFNKEYVKAIHLLENYNNIDSTNYICLSNLADNYYNIDSINIAIKYYKEVLILNPDNQLIANKLANLYIKINKPKEAIKICDTILKNDTANIKFIKTKGLALFKDSNFEDALKLFKRAYILGDSTFFTIKYLGISNYKTNNYFDAVAYLNKALTRDSLNVEMNYFYGAALGHTMKKTEAIKYLNKAYELMQPDKETVEIIFNEKAIIYLVIEEYNKSLECNKIVYKNNPSKIIYLYKIASLLENKLNNKNEALEYYQKFVDEVSKSELSNKNLSSYKSSYIKYLYDFSKERITKIKEELFFQGNSETRE
ncbi:MAG: tetratricopeptide repeat protein [Bacteroidales bacterium]|nr:tetratricopeptide repeat protein [Bacteroidales bacterium]